MIRQELVACDPTAIRPAGEDRRLEGLRKTERSVIGWKDPNGTLAQGLLCKKSVIAFSDLCAD